MKYLLSCLFAVLAIGMKAQMVCEVPSSVMADVTICKVSNPILADVIVYRAESSSNPAIQKNEGVWYFCPNQIMANFNICYVPEVSADLKVYFTDNPILAGWKNPQKKYLFKKD